MTYTVERTHCCVGGGREAVFRLTYELSYIENLQLWRCFLIHSEEIGEQLPERRVLSGPALMPDLGTGANDATRGRAA